MSLTSGQQKNILKLENLSNRIFELNPLATEITVQLENMEYNDENYYGGSMQFYVKNHGTTLDEVTITKSFQDCVKKMDSFFHEYDEIADPEHNYITLKRDKQFKTSVTIFDRDTYEEDKQIVEGKVENNHIIVN